MNATTLLLKTRFPRATTKVSPGTPQSAQNLLLGQSQTSSSTWKIPRKACISNEGFSSEIQTWFKPDFKRFPFSRDNSLRVPYLIITESIRDPRFEGCFPAVQFILRLEEKSDNVMTSYILFCTLKQCYLLEFSLLLLKI